MFCRLEKLRVSNDFQSEIAFLFLFKMEWNDADLVYVIVWRLKELKKIILVKSSNNWHDDDSKIGTHEQLWFQKSLPNIIVECFGSDVLGCYIK